MNKQQFRINLTLPIRIDVLSSILLAKGKHLSGSVHTGYQDIKDISRIPEE